VAVRPVLRLPAPALKAVARPVGDAVPAAAMAADLVDTMRAYDHCVGLAAPQIGVGLRAFCVDVTGHPKARSCAGLVVLLDPELVAAGAPAVAREGCMSVPDLTGNVAGHRRGPGDHPAGRGRRHRGQGAAARARPPGPAAGP
jgi:peptide deformylase